MRKYLFLFSVFLLFGCTKLEKDNYDYQRYVNAIFTTNNKNNFVNATSTGFKYYLPRGVILKQDIDNNIILSVENTNIYFFVDVINYYYNKKFSVIDASKYDYYKDISDDGYLIVDENNGKYLINIAYNNSIIEFYTTKNKISKLLTLSSIILRSIQFNDEIIEKKIIEDYISNSDKVYEISELKKTDSKFSQYLNSYEEENIEKNKLPE